MFPAELTLVIDHGQSEQSRQGLPQSQSTEKIRDQAGGLEKRRIDSGICRRGDKAPIDLSHLKRLNSLRKRVWERGRGAENPEVEDETRSAKGEFWRIRRKLIVETIGWKRAVCLGPLQRTARANLEAREMREKTSNKSQEAQRGLGQRLKSCEKS